MKAIQLYLIQRVLSGTNIAPSHQIMNHLFAFRISDYEEFCQEFWAEAKCLSDLYESHKTEAGGDFEEASARSRMDWLQGYINKIQRTES